MMINQSKTAQDDTVRLAEKPGDERERKETIWGALDLKPPPYS
jgi:hypothetical protein